MKLMKIFLLIVFTLMVSNVEAKPLKTNSVYMFGFSASFKDSVIYVTDIQNVQGAWIESKTKFLMGRDSYSYQLNNHLTDSLKQSQRISMVFFSLKKKKAEKQYIKLMKKYKKGYEVRYLNAPDFRFKAVDMSSDNQ